MKIKTCVAGLATAVALALASVMSAGTANADPKRDDLWVPGDPPGQNPWGPPGQLNKAPTPFYGVPPGHWDDPVRVGLPSFWLPPLELLPSGYPTLGGPLPVVWDQGNNAFGVWIGEGLFIAIPLP